MDQLQRDQSPMGDTGQGEQRARRSKGRRGQGRQRAAEQGQGRPETRPEDIQPPAQYEAAEHPAGPRGLTLPDSIRNQQEGPPGRRGGRGDSGTGTPAGFHPAPASVAGGRRPGPATAYGRHDHRGPSPAISQGVQEDRMRSSAAGNDQQDYSSEQSAEAGPAPSRNRQPARAPQAALSREQRAQGVPRRSNAGIGNSQGQDVARPSDQYEGTSALSGMRSSTQQPAAAAAAAADWHEASRDDSSEPGPSGGRGQPRARQGRPRAEQLQWAAGQSLGIPHTPQSQNLQAEGGRHVDSAGSGARHGDEQAADASRGSRRPPQGAPGARDSGPAGRRGPEQAADLRRGGRGRGRGQSPLGAEPLPPAGAGRQGRGSGSRGRRGRSRPLGLQGDSRDTERSLPDAEGPRQIYAQLKTRELAVSRQHRPSLQTSLVSQRLSLLQTLHSGSTRRAMEQLRPSDASSSAETPQQPGLLEGAEIVDTDVVSRILRPRMERPSMTRIPTEKLAAMREAVVSIQKLRDEMEVQGVDIPSCVVCSEEMRDVAIGSCNHKAVCAECCLKQRECYSDKKCPLCKTEQHQVVLAVWRPSIPDWSNYKSRLPGLHKLIINYQWSLNVFVDDSRSPQAWPLHAQLERMTARACYHCDPVGTNPFPSLKSLQRHMQREHSQRLCHVCLEASRYWILELQPMPHKELLKHIEERHPLCRFCKELYFTQEELYNHMRISHFTCHVCERSDHYNHFNEPEAFLQHLRYAHHLCNMGNCLESYVAFESLDELQQHQRMVHSSSMPRWDQSRARVVPLSELFVASPEQQQRPRRPQGRQGEQAGSSGLRAGSRPGSHPESARRGGAPAAAATASVAEAEPASAGPSQESGSTAAATNRSSSRQQGEGGMVMIDDNEFPEVGHAAVGGSQQAAPAGGGGQAEEAFPDLGSAAIPPPSAAQPPSRRAPPLVTQRIKCHCGRRVSHVAVVEGQQAAPLACDGECDRVNRQKQLAGAFGVVDPAHHVPVFDRQRLATLYPRNLLVAAVQSRPFIAKLEQAFAAFMADRDHQRHALAPMPHKERALVHQLASLYNFTSCSFKQEPARYVSLFKTAASGQPEMLLSEVAQSMPREEMKALAAVSAQEDQSCLKLIEVQANVDLAWFLKRWEGQYRMEWLHGAPEVIVRFTSPALLQEALDSLGGGVRGVFMVDRQWTKRNAESARAQVQTPTGSSAAQAGHQPRPPAASSAAAGGSSAAATRVPAAAFAPGRGDSDDAFQTVAGRRRKLTARRGTDAAGEQAEVAQPPAAAAGRGRGADLQIHWHVSSSASPLDFSEPWHEDGSGSSKSPGMETKNSRLRAALASLADVPMEDWEALAQERQAGSSATSSIGAPEARAGANAEAGGGMQQEGTGSGGSHSPETAQQQGPAASPAASVVEDGEHAAVGDREHAVSMAASERSYCTALPTPQHAEGAASPQVPTPEAAGGGVGPEAHTRDVAGSSAGGQSPASEAPRSESGGS